MYILKIIPKDINKINAVIIVVYIFTLFSPLWDKNILKLMQQDKYINNSKGGNVGNKIQILNVLFLFRY